MVPSYIESPRPGPTSPQMIWRPRCIMKPFIEPALPSTMIVPPFWSMPEFQKFVCGKKLYNYDSLEPSERKLVL